VFVVVYPRADAGAFGAGSDRDDALNIGISRLLQGLYPYDAVTYFGNKITPMPGALLIAAPFWLVFGNAAVQNLFWVPLTFPLLRSLSHDLGEAFCLWVTLFAAPGVLREVVSGGDLVVNAIYVALALRLVVASAQRRLWLQVVGAVGLGVALSSRPNFWLVLPLLLAYLWRTRGPLQALLTVGCATAVSAALTLPFYLADPAGFSPLHVMAKVASSDGSSSSRMVLELVAVGVIAVVVVFARITSEQRLYAVCTTALALPVLAVLVETRRRTGVWDAGDLGFVYPAAVFATMLVASLIGRTNERASADPQQAMGRGHDPAREISD